MENPETATHAMLRCPNCESILTEEGVTILCERCSSRWPVINGIPFFVNTAPYWGEQGITPEVMGELLQDMESKSWHAAMKNHPSPKVQERYEFVSDLSRADWHKMLALGDKSIALDFGAGLGTISQAISRSCGHVFAVEQVEERVQFMRLRFRQEGCKNITVLRANADTLPFAAGTFDLIVLNGVLEWLPLSRKDLDPRDGQLHYLRTFQKLLKPGGILYVGIENRTDYSLLLGAPDPHIAIRYVAILPRWIADLVCKARIRDRYRPYLYSHAGYRKLLSEAGYRSVEIFTAFPSYNKPRKMLNLREKSDQFVNDFWLTKNRFSRWVKGIMVRVDLLKYFGYAYIIFARR
jgi:SAM-dependent methyltransferase